MIKKCIAWDIVNKLFSKSSDIWWQKHSKQRRQMQIPIENPSSEVNHCSLHDGQGLM